MKELLPECTMYKYLHLPHLVWPLSVPPWLGQFQAGQLAVSIYFILLFIYACLAAQAGGRLHKCFSPWAAKHFGPFLPLGLALLMYVLPLVPIPFFLPPGQRSTPFSSSEHITCFCWSLGQEKVIPLVNKGNKALCFCVSFGISVIN